MFVEKPQGGRQRNREKHVGGHRNHAVDHAAVHDFFSDLVFRIPGIGSGVGHHKTGPAFFIQRIGKQRDPEVIGIGDAVVGVFSFVFWQPEFIKPFIVFYGTLLNRFDVKRRIGHHKIEPAEAAVRVAFIRIYLCDFASDVVHHQVHFRQTGCFAHILLTVNIDIAKVVVRFLHKLGALHKHTARTAGRIINFPGIRLNDFNNKPYHRCWREKLSAFLSFAHREFTQEVFINLTKNITGGIFRDVGKRLEQLGKNVGFLFLDVEVGILGENIFKLFVLVLLDAFHRFPQGFCQTLVSRQI